MVSCIRMACLLIVSAAWLIPSAQAQTRKDMPARYELQKTEQGLVRLDTVTGIISSCQYESDKLTCQPSVDGITIYEEEIARLEANNSKLKQKLIRLSEVLLALSEDALISADQASEPFSLSPSQTQSGSWFSEDDKARLNEALSVTEQTMRRFFSVIEEMKKDYQHNNSE